MKENDILLLLHTNELTSYRYLIILLNIRKHGHLSVNDVADVTLTSSASASQMIEVLVNKCFVNVTIDPADRRKRVITLTPESTEFLTKYDDCYAETNPA